MNYVKILALSHLILFSAYAAHINVPEGVPGISSLFVFSPETAKPLRQLAELLLRTPSTLSSGERELIASYVSHLNKCVYCYSCHSAATNHLFKDDSIMEGVINDLATAPISEKMKALLNIAALVQQSGSLVTKEDVEQAKNAGATDKEIHDTVLIAAAFCMYNRYVDGLGTWTPTDPAIYDLVGQHLAEFGYLNP